MSPRKEIHVVPCSTGGWDVKKKLEEKPIKNFRLKNDARSFAIGLAKLDKAELIIHTRSGRITECNSYGNDPKRSKG